MNVDFLNQFYQNVFNFQAVMNKCLLSVLLDGRIKSTKEELAEMYRIGNNPSPFFNMVYGYDVKCRDGRIVIRDIHADNKVVFEAVVK